MHSDTALIADRQLALLCQSYHRPLHYPAAPRYLQLVRHQPLRRGGNPAGALTGFTPTLIGAAATSRLSSAPSQCAADAL